MIKCKQVKETNSEKKLANVLRRQCLSNGKEIDPKESAKTLHQLGLVYKEKSPDKISLIQSVALMTSAVLRQPDNADDIKKDLNDVCLHILTLANASKLDTTLVDTASVEAKQKIALLRETVKRDLEILQPISDDLNGTKKKKARKIRVAKIRKIQDYVTETYTSIMQLIANHTLSILGEAPCKFALVGMGSLAKKEITPYSDFESIIVLEDKIKKNLNYQNILEYFQWFSSVFQMILVRLGETLLKFLAIPCLNNPLNKEEDWFYDAFTPCGISPDGFAPHASKNPLGRQTKTQNKPWTTELIKPVSEMVKYLETEEDLKNGYHLAEMLTKTSFVAGNYNIYKKFCAKARNKLCMWPKFNAHVRQKIVKDFEKYSLAHADTEHHVDLKRFVYRSCSLFVHAVGYLHETTASNCFDIMDELLNRGFGVITETLHSKVQSSLAVACEMRLRMYSNALSQEDILHQNKYCAMPSCINEFTTCIGARTVVDCLNVATELQLYIVICFKNANVFNICLVREVPLKAVNIAKSVKLYGFAVRLVDEIRKLPEHQNVPSQFDLLVSYSDCLRGNGEYKRCLKIINANLRILRKIGLMQFSVLLWLIQAQCLIALNKYKQALKCYRKVNFFTFFHLFPVTDGLQVHVGMGDCFKKLRRNKKAYKHLKRAYDDVKNDPMKGKIRNEYFEISQHYGFCLLHLAMHEEAKAVHQNLIDTRRQLYVDDESDFVLNMASFHIAVSLCFLKRYEESLNILEKAWKCVQNISEEIHIESYSTYIRTKACCLAKLGKGFEAMDLLFAYFISDRMTKNSITQHSVWQHLIRVFDQCGLYEGCILYIKNLLEYYARLKQTKSVRKVVKQLQQQIEEFQDKIDNYSECKLDEDAKQIIKTDFKVKIIHLSKLATNSLKHEKLDEAMAYFREIETLLPKVKENSLSLLKLTDVEFHSIVFCGISSALIREGQHQEAVMYSKKAFNLPFQLCRRHFNEGSIDATVNLVECFITFRRYKEGLAAAKHGIRLCQFLCDNPFMEPKFIEIVSALADCEEMLKISSSLTFDCTPSMYYNAPDRYANSMAEKAKDLPHYCVEVKMY